MEEIAKELSRNKFNKKWKKTLNVDLKDDHECNETGESDKGNDSNDETIATSDNETTEINKIHDDSSSGEESDPFDFVTVRILTS